MLTYAQLKQARRPGMILLLVVAVLVLLALMGTVFILSASTDKQVSYASNDQANLNYASQGALSIVRADILNTTLGPGNTPLTLGSQTPARVWTGPDIGYAPNGMIATPMEDANSGGGAPSSGQPEIASQPWLCGLMPYEPNTIYQLGTTTVPAVGPGSTVPDVQVYGGTGTPATRPVGAYEPLISVLTPALYDPADGAYDISYYGMNLNQSQTAGAGGVVAVPNASVVMPAYTYNPAAATSNANPLVSFGTRDAMWNMLPYSSPNGTHYRFAVRIMDTSALMNVNTGWIAADTNSPTPSSSNGVYADTGAAMASYPIYALPGTYDGGDNPANMQAAGQNPPTRAGNYNPTNYDLLNWQQELAYYENQGAPNANNEYLNLYGPGTELQWLAYGGAGGQFRLRSPNRLGSQIPSTSFGVVSTPESYEGTGYQAFYTTYSWSRQYASAQATNAPASLTTGMSALYPSRVNLNAGSISTSNEYTLAVQIANALATCGYNADRACEYAANYFSYRYGVTGSSSEPAVLTSGSLTSVIGASSAGTGTLPAGAGTYFIGNTAQPFINEMEITLQYSGSNTPAVKGYGIELKNPFPSTSGISLTGWQLIVLNSSGTAAVTIPLTNQTIVGYGTASHFLVAYNGSTPAINGTKVAGPSASSFPTSGEIILTRPCTGAPADGAVAAGFAAVDAMPFTVGPPGGANPTGTYYVDASRAAGEWGCDSSQSASITLRPQQSSAGVSLGSANTPGTGIAAAASGAPGLPLYDRFADGDPVGSFAPTAANNYQILNWADANCIARECSIESPGAAAGTPNYAPVSWQIGSNAAKTIPTLPGYTPVTDEGYLYDIYFDFPFDPRAALTAADMPTSGPVEPNVLTMFSLNARADDPSVTPVGVAYANLLTRTPGRINVNTAGEVPLFDAIYDAAIGTLGTTKGPPITAQLEADTIAYRDRLGSNNSQVPAFESAPGGTPTVQATTTPNYSTTVGYNIKSLGDLLYAWLQDQQYEKAVSGGATPTSFVQRDALWAACANNFCVHSDTFAVYGLVQAIRLNPNYVSSGGTINNTDWYNANQSIYGNNGTIQGMLSTQSSITTSSGTTAIPEFILEGQRRFVAIVDSSYSTPAGTTGTPPAPKIVAIKYLPQ